jgi:hypothetical protein
MSKAFDPVSLITEIAPAPDGVEIATIVSFV